MFFEGKLIFIDSTKPCETMLSTKKYVIAFSFLDVLPLTEVKLYFQAFPGKQQVSVVLL